MERVLTPDEKLRRAEEIYYRRKGANTRENTKTVNVPVSNQKYLMKKMIIQIVICFLVYCSYYVVKNYNFIFSKELIDKTSQILSYDIDIQEIYCKVANYINNYSYFKQQDEQKQQQENMQDDNTSNEENAIDDNTQDNTDTLSSADETIEEVASTEETLNQMQMDAEEIKKNYSLINPLSGQVTSRFGTRTPTEEIISPYHVGLDIAANTGTVIVASMDGEVITSQELAGYGKCIQIQKDDILTIYGHCNKLYVNKGDNVSQGQQIAEVGETRKCNRTSFAF